MFVHLLISTAAYAIILKSIRFRADNDYAQTSFYGEVIQRGDVKNGN